MQKTPNHALVSVIGTNLADLNPAFFRSRLTMMFRGQARAYIDGSSQRRAKAAALSGAPK